MKEIMNDIYLIDINAGIDYGLTFGARYGYHLKTTAPIMLIFDLSVPSGENLADEFRNSGQTGY